MPNDDLTIPENWLVGVPLAEHEVIPSKRYQRRIALPLAFENNVAEGPAARSALIPSDPPPADEILAELPVSLLRKKWRQAVYMAPPPNGPRTGWICGDKTAQMTLEMSVMAVVRP